MGFLLQFIGWFSFFLALALILPNIIPVPGQLQRRIRSDVKVNTAFYSYTSNYVSVFHAVYVFYASLTILLREGINYVGYNTPQQTSIFAFSCGYFLNDLIFGYLKKYNDTATHFHHIFSIGSLVYTLLKGQYGDNLLWAFVITEVSNPFLLLSRNFETTDSCKRLAFPLSLTFAIVFIFARTVIAYKFIPAMMNEPVCLFLKLNCAFLCMLTRVHLAVLGAHRRAQADQGDL